MIPLEQCATILNKGKKKYDNEQAKIIRQYLYLLAELQIENEKIALTKKQDYECKCNNILSSKFG